MTVYVIFNGFISKKSAFLTTDKRPILLKITY